MLRNRARRSITLFAFIHTSPSGGPRPTYPVPQTRPQRAPKPQSTLGDFVAGHQLERLDERRVIEIGHAVCRTYLHELRRSCRLWQGDVELASALQCQAKVLLVQLDAKAR